VWPPSRVHNPHWESAGEGAPTWRPLALQVHACEPLPGLGAPARVQRSAAPGHRAARGGARQRARLRAPNPNGPKQRVRFGSRQGPYPACCGLRAAGWRRGYCMHGACACRARAGRAVGFPPALCARAPQPVTCRRRQPWPACVSPGSRARRAWRCDSPGGRWQAGLTAWPRWRSWAAARRRCRPRWRARQRPARRAQRQFPCRKDPHWARMRGEHGLRQGLQGVSARGCWLLR